MTSELDGYSQALRASWETVRDTMVSMSLFVERKAAEGDVEAQLLAEDLAAARLWMGLENVFAREALKGVQDG